MSDTTFLQILGTFAIALVGAFGLYIVANVSRWCEYGRLTLAVLAGAQFYFVAIRALYLAHWTESHTTILLSGIGGMVLACIELNLIVMHWQWHRSGLADHGHKQKEYAT